MIATGTGLQNLPRSQDRLVRGAHSASTSLTTGKNRAEGSVAPLPDANSDGFTKSVSLTDSMRGDQKTELPAYLSDNITAQQLSTQHTDKASRDTTEGRQEDTAPDDRQFSERELSDDEILGDVLSDHEQKILEELKKRDAQIRAHEQAYRAAAGSLIQGNISYSYETGPDGRRYAVGTHVDIDTSEVPGDPYATLIKAQRIKRAVSSAIEPSTADRAVAAEAARMEARAREEISQQARAKQQQYIEDNKPEVDFWGPEIKRIEKQIQDLYQRIQNSSLPSASGQFIDVFI